MNIRWSYLLLLLVPFLLSLMLVGGDTMQVTLWWLCLLMIGLIFLPLTSKVFSKFYDKGYLFSKTIGLALPTLVLWLLSSFKLLPFTTPVVYGVLAVALVIVLIPLKGYKFYKELLKDPAMQRTFILEEGLFFLLLVFFCFIRGNNPDAGMERWMDYALLNNMLNTKYMPPVDMWYAGTPLNYYYYGHYVFAFLTRMCNIMPSITYSLAMSSLFAFGFSLTYSISSNIFYLLGTNKLKKVIAAGMISAFLLAFGGNLHTFFYSGVVPFANAIGLYNGKVYPTENTNAYYYADARSYIGENPKTNDKGITEYPAYSFILGDLHAQIIDIIFVLTFIALLLAFLVRSTEEARDGTLRDEWYIIPLDNILMIALLPVMWMTNAWDFPIYLTVAGAVLLYVGLVKHGFKLQAIVHTLINWLKLLIIPLILLIPFFMNFFNPTDGTKLTNWLHLLSPLYIFQLFVVWGYQVIIVVLFFVFLFVAKKKYGLSAVAQRKKAKQHFVKAESKGSTGFWGGLKCFVTESPPMDVFAVIIAICAIGLVLVPELIYQKDVSGAGYERSNTMWKVTLQAFILFDIIIGYIALRIFSVKRPHGRQTALGFTIGGLIFLAMLYPLVCLGQPYNGLSQYKTQDITATFKTESPDDYGAIQYLKENEKAEPPVILEANGDSYSKYCRIYYMTGFPTILGWYVHEWYWRGRTNEQTETQKRVKEVSTVYESDDVNATKEILSKYKIKYIVLGALEKEKFKAFKEQKLLSLGELVYNSPGTKMIKVG